MFCFKTVKLIKCILVSVLLTETKICIVCLPFTEEVML